MNEPGRGGRWRPSIFAAARHSDGHFYRFFLAQQRNLKNVLTGWCSLMMDVNFPFLSIPPRVTKANIVSSYCYGCWLLERGWVHFTLTRYPLLFHDIFTRFWFFFAFAFVNLISSVLASLRKPRLDSLCETVCVRRKKQGRCFAFFCVHSKCFFNDKRTPTHWMKSDWLYFSTIYASIWVFYHIFAFTIAALVTDSEIYCIFNLAFLLSTQWFTRTQKSILKNVPNDWKNTKFYRTKTRNQNLRAHSRHDWLKPSGYNCLGLIERVFHWKILIFTELDLFRWFSLSVVTGRTVFCQSTATAT